MHKMIIAIFIVLKPCRGLFYAESCLMSGANERHAMFAKRVSVICHKHYFSIIKTYGFVALIIITFLSLTNRAAYFVIK